MRADGNGDGRMDLREILEFARTQPLPGSPPEIAFRPVLSLDENGDGATDNAEFDRAAERMFRSVDTDRDGLLSPQEADAFRTRNNGGGTARSDAANRRAEQSLARARAGCAMPPASEGAKVVLFSAYEGEALSTTTIGSQDVAVGTATITIEPGREPIYLVVAVGEATIWRVSGAVGRLERLVLTSNKTRPRGATPDERPLVGATGVAAGKVTFLERTGCVRPFTEAPSSASASAVGVVMRETGKRPDVIAAQYGVAGFSIPSGQVSSQRPAGGGPIIVVQREGSLTIKGDTKNVIVETGGMGTLERELLRFSPGGVVTINAADVVASAPAEPYVVLPQQAGLIQLVQSGALRQTRNGEFLITRKIRMPAELNGAHQAKFVLLRGVPEPDGDFGHSTVISEETGQQLNSRMPR
jgi:hypothetical protein